MTAHAKHLAADERRAVTVEAVVALAAEQNPSDITTTAIAQRMGLTQGALFRHFPSKDAILEAIMSWVTQRLLARVDKAAAGAASPLPALVGEAAAVLFIGTGGAR
jgi:AcrR family transcriptional regulator